MELMKNEDIKKTQMEILDAVHAFCTEKKITYFLTGGTLIGALRHEGYIPWDDDIDIMMYRDEYVRFIKEFNEFQTRYYAFSIEYDKGYNYHFCKVCDTETYLEEGLRVNDVDLGINIDVFPLDKLPNSVDEKKTLNRLHALDKLMYCKSFRWSNLSKRKLLHQIKILLLKAVAVFTTRYHLGLRQSQIAQRFSDSTTCEYSIVTCHMRKAFPRIDRSATTAELHVFEGKEYYIPNTYDRYLSIQFGDYMTLPPVEKQVTHHNFLAYRFLDGTKKCIETRK